MNQDNKKALKKDLGNRFLKGLKHLFLHNWSYKLLAVVLALILWAGLIAQDPTLTREKTFTNVNVNVIGMDNLKKDGYVVVNNLDELLEDCQFTVAVPQQQYNTVDAASFNLRLDLSRIHSAGEQEIRLQYSNNSTYGTVTSVSPETVTVKVEEYTTRSRIPISVNLSGGAPEGWYISAAVADPALIAVSGPKSIVDTISRAKVTLEPEQIIWVEGVSKIVAPFELYDRSGARVENNQIETSNEGVLINDVMIEHNLYPVKEVQLSDLGLIHGSTATGYEVTNVLYTPEKISIAAPKKILETIDKLFTSSEIDITKKNESFTEQIKIIRPPELNYISTDLVNAEIEISPVITEKVFALVNVELRNVPNDMKASVDTKNLDLTLSGEQLWLEKTKKKDVQLFVDLDGIEEEGTYTLFVDCEVANEEDKDFDWTASSDDVIVTLTKKNAN